MPSKISKVLAVWFVVATTFFALLTARFLLHTQGLKPVAKPEPDLEPAYNGPRHDIWGIPDLLPSIEVSTIVVQQVVDQAEPPLKQRVPISPRFISLDLTGTGPVVDLPVAKASIRIPRPPKPDASGVIFGLATKLERLQIALPAIALWASGAKARFVALVDTSSGIEGPGSSELIQLYRDHDISLTIIHDASEWWDQYTSLLKVLYSHADDGTKWVCILDDDTFILSMRRVLGMLAQFDASQPHYIGGLSENKESLDRLGIFAYGGAGIFLSISLLAELQPYVDLCVAASDPAGDIRISNCIYNYTATKLSWNPRLFQMDLHGDVTGFYEGVRPLPLTTHHWKTWHHHDMVLTSAVSQACANGMDCVLQKYQLDDGWMLTNGFSLIRYSYSAAESASFVDVAMEHTWADTSWVIPTSWTYTLYPLKPRDEGKVQFMIERADHDEQDSLTVYYVKRDRSTRMGQAIVRMIWEKDQMS